MCIPQFVFVGCLACGFLLHFAPEEPSEEVNGGIYTTVPTIALLCAAILTVVALVLGCTGACKDSKLILVVVRTYNTVEPGHSLIHKDKKDKIAGPKVSF